MDQCLRDLNLEISVEKDAKEACERALEAKVNRGGEKTFKKDKLRKKFFICGKICKN